MNASRLRVLSPHETVHCDYLVIGSGAGGSVAARELAAAGHHVVIAEEGSYFTEDQFREPVGVLMRKLYRLGGVTPFFGRPSIGFAEARCVGGGTVINGGLLWRTPPWILEEWQRSHGLQGFTERDLAPHFQTIERLLNVRAANDLDGNQDSRLLAQAARSLGWKVSAARRALGDCRNSNRCPTGCPTAAKKSTVLTYLAEARAHGAELMSNVRVYSLKPHRGRIKEALSIADGRIVRFVAQRYFLAAGPIQTPHLLSRSKVCARAGRQLRFHVNLKFVAMFDAPIHAAHGTMFTEQIQEYEQQGLYIMASNWLPHYAAATLSHQPLKEVESVLEDFHRASLFIAQIRSRAHGRVLSCFDRPIVWQSLAGEDLEQIRFACRKTGEVLFKAGATKIYLPFSGEPPVTSPTQLDAALARIVPNRLELISVHAMSSCPMSGRGREEAVVDLEGRVTDLSNLWICDASVLPDNIGESPQETIMAFAHEILARHLLR